jgi:hypothetical protein
VGLNALKSLNLTNVYPNNKNNKKNNNKVKSKPLELFELAGKKFGGLGPLDWEEIENAQTVVNSKLKPSPTNSIE